ncbi:Cytochrome-b5 reductase [Purpureocillium takamizusanense]|uniref:Cytochrome-b5 reductase n=1 Tax=Purpureocillium takamizusanense TaxID=2060973 RepID=A0A9Q8QB40_9HYPO|nr:Cytochrome-b5 reductase [Purpureocillium takamizusanense]UNI15607.1 Cytochrome-b5 reductase [Purpureocillium takamizusanense]
MKEFTAKEVAEHKSPQDAWLAIHGKVYDVTKYLNDHPGGAEVLAEAAGTDASEEFDNAGHSEDAFELMESYLVGSLQGFEKKKPKRKPVRVVTQPTTQPEQSGAVNGGGAVTKTVILGLFSLVVGAVYYSGRRWGLKTPLWAASLLQFGGGKSSPGGFGFVRGILIGGGALAAIQGIVARRFAQLVWGSKKTFTSYPAHMMVPKRIEEDTLLQRGLLDPVKYSSLPLKTKTLIAPNVYRFIFTLPTASTVLGLPIGQHVVIKADVAGESVARSYTPVSNNADRGVLELLVKVYPGGKLTSGYLAGLQTGDEVLFRGPKGAMRYRPGLCRKLGMVAGGTGITPMFQVIRAICEHDRDTTHVSLLYANRTEEDILLREELDAFARRYPKNLQVYYLLDRPPEKWEYGSGYVTRELMADKLPGPGPDTKMMLCGPPGLVTAAKKSLVSLGFEQPGASAKATDQIFCF